MNSFLLLALLPVSALAAPPAGNKLLDCNLSFGPVQQLVVYQNGDALNYNLLTSTGRWLNGNPLEQAAWDAHKIDISYRSDRIVLSSDNGGKDWSYAVYSDGFTETGAADCD